jgi:hypothetical protein
MNLSNHTRPGNGRMRKGATETPSLRRPALALTCLLAVCCAFVFFSYRPATEAAGQGSGKRGDIRVFNDLKPKQTAARRADAKRALGAAPTQMAASAVKQIEALRAEKAARTPAQRKMDSNLLYAMRMATGKQIASGVTRLETGVDVKNGMVKVDIRVPVNDATLAMVKGLGGEVIRSFAFAKSIEANFPVSQLETLAADSRVLHIARPSGAVTNRSAETPKSDAPTAAGPESPMFGATGRKPSLAERQERVKAKVASALAAMTAQGSVVPVFNIPGIRTSVAEGDFTHRSRAARTTFRVDGTGLKIGILSDSFNNLGGYAADATSGELPGPGNPNGLTTVVGLAGSGDLDPTLGGSDEGRAMAQIIHAVAPGAQLFFATAFNGIEDFANNILALRGISPDPGPFGNVPGGCDVIVDDVFYFVETGLHDGQVGAVTSPLNMAIVTQAVNDVTANGALYFSSAGNSGNLNDDTSGAWEGDFTSAGPAPGPLAMAGDALNWTPGTGMMNPTNQILAADGPVTMQWSDPLGASNNDYDMYILNPAGDTVLGASTDTQDGSMAQDPFEGIGGPAVSAGNLLVVTLFMGNPRFISLSTNRGLLQFATDGQTRGHSCAVNGFGVAATPTSAGGGSVGPFPGAFVGTNMVENFSSDGFRRSFFNPDGTAITPNNFLAATNGGVVRQKPDITAADGAPTTVPGFERFFGTSAAAPHACAIAGLVKSGFIRNGVMNPTVAQVRAVLQNTAIDIEAMGVDRDSGVGILQAFQAVQATGVAGGVGLDFGTVTATEGTVSNGNSFIEPGETANMTVQLSNLGIANATSVSATISSMTPGVTVLTPNLRLYGAIAQNASATNSVPFTFSLAPSAACGLNADFVLTATSFDALGNSTVRQISLRVPTGQTSVSVTTQLDATAPTANPNFTATTGLQTGRLLGNGIISSCAMPKPAPPLSGNQPTAMRRFDAYTFMNAGPARCVTVTVNPPLANPATPPFNNFVQSVGYSVFTPATPNTGYLGDAGIGGLVSLAPGDNFTYSFIAPANAPFTVTVVETNPGGAVANPPSANTYTLTVSGLNLCQPAGVAQAVVNNRMALMTVGAPQIVAPTCGMQGSANDLILNATVTNTGTTAVQTIAFRVAELREANGVAPATPFRLISADGASCMTGGLVGAVQTLTMPAALLPGQSAPVQFRIAIPEVRRFRFLVDVLGIDTGVTGSVTPSKTTAGTPLGFDVAFDGQRKAVVNAIADPTPVPAGGAPIRSHTAR